MILLILLIMLILIISFNNENFELLGTKDDIFKIKDEKINLGNPCILNGDENIIGDEVIIIDDNGRTVQTCDFGKAINDSCDHLQFNCDNDRCTEEKVMPLLTINNEVRCRKQPYRYY